jgi:hypothetical protein
MAILKLALGRQNAIGGVVAAVTVDETGKFGPQYKVDFENGDTIYVNTDPFDRQMGFHKITPDQLVGQTVTLWKKPVPGDDTGRKGYFNVELGSAPAGGTAAASGGVGGYADNDDYVARDLRTRGVPLPAVTLDDMADKYQECLAKAHAIVTDYQETFETSMGPDALTSIAATLYIERNKRGA